jgi:hypothetical protein
VRDDNPRPEDTSRTISASLTVNVGRIAEDPKVTVLVRVPQEQRVVVSGPVLEVDDTTRMPRVDRWQPLLEATVTAEAPTVQLTLDREVVALGDGVSRPVQTNGGWKNPAHDSHIEWAAKLFDIYGIKEFGEAAETWGASRHAIRTEGEDPLAFWGVRDPSGEAHEEASENGSPVIFDAPAPAVVVAPPLADGLLQGEREEAAGAVTGVADSAGGNESDGGPRGGDPQGVGLEPRTVGGLDDPTQ